jgi:hypothetical protein
MDLAKMRIENEIFPLAQTPFHLMFPYTCCCCRGCHRKKDGYETDIATEIIACDKLDKCSEIKEHKEGKAILVPINKGSSYLYKLNKEYSPSEVDGVSDRILESENNMSTDLNNLNESSVIILKGKTTKTLADAVALKEYYSKNY